MELGIVLRDTATGFSATVTSGARSLSSDEVARLGIIRWYVADRLVATGASCDVDYGTTVECRLEA